MTALNDSALGEPVVLRAGALSVSLHEGTLRHVNIGDEKALAQVSVAVRDSNWGTIPGVLEELAIDTRADGFTVTFRSVHETSDVDFTWAGRIEGCDDTITYTMDGLAHADFLANRIGFCLVHPLSLAGAFVSVTSPEGAVEQAQFPVEIAATTTPTLPEMSGMSYDVGANGRLEIVFTGDIFETEDQRNWSDASFKTFCTPLRLPYPRPFRAGERVSQSVTLTGRGAAAKYPPKRERRQPIVVHADQLPPLPVVGFGMHTQGGPLDAGEQGLVRRLKPEHIRSLVDLAQTEWRGELDAACAQAVALGVPVDLDIISHDDADLAALVEHLRWTGKAVRTLYLFNSGTWSTSAALVRSARELLSQVDHQPALGGGSIANFAEFNRAVLPVSLLDVLSVAINPQVHAFDEESIMGTLQAQSQILVSARLRSGTCRLSVGPVTLLPAFNPVATTAESAPTEGDLPKSVDIRQASQFAAAWTVGSVVALAAADSITFHETAGWRGTFARAGTVLTSAAFPAAPGTVFPLHKALEQVAQLRGQPRYVIENDDPTLAVIAVGEGRGGDILIANLTPQPRMVKVMASDLTLDVTLPAYGTELRRLPAKLNGTS